MFINISINNTSDPKFSPFQTGQTKSSSLPFKPFPKVFADEKSLNNDFYSS